MVLTARLTQRWADARMLVQPATLLRGHGALYRRGWAWKSSAQRTARPTLAAETTQWIRQMATANWLWGAERIRGELLKLGVHVCTRTVQKYMRRARPRRTSYPLPGLIATPLPRSRRAMAAWRSLVTMWA
jgi:putative transposase